MDTFAESESNTQKYGKNFRTMMPNECDAVKTVEELKSMACKLGDRNADWVEQALEWAQRISNGESWEELCDKADIANNRRLVVRENGYWIVGGSCYDRDYDSATKINNLSIYFYGSIYRVVPLVVSYK